MLGGIIGWWVPKRISQPRQFRKPRPRNVRPWVEILEERSCPAGAFIITGSSPVQEPLTTSEAKYADFTVSLYSSFGPPPSGTVTATASSQGADTATAGADFQVLTWNITLGPTHPSEVIHVPIYYDVESESNETFRVTLSNPTNGNFISSDTAYGTIIDAPVNPMFVSITADRSQIMEGESVNFRIARSATEGPLTVYFEAQGTASSADYQASPAVGSATFTDGQSEAVVAVTALDDGVIESSETLVLQLLTTAPGTLGPAQYLITGTSNAGVSIQDPGLPTVWLGSASPVDEGAARQITFYRSTSIGSLTVLFDVSGTATPTSDYGLTPSSSVTFAPGQTEATVVLDAVADDLPEGDEVANIAIVLPSQGPAPYNIGSPGGLGVQIYDTSGYHVTDFTVAWQKPDESWQNSPDSEMLWEEDMLKWTAQLNSGALPYLIRTEWYKRPFGAPNDPWVQFAVSPTGVAEVLASPQIGDWAIKVDAVFAHVVAQAAAKHRPLNGIRAEWLPGDDQQRFFYAEEDITDYPNHYGPRVYPERNTAGDEILHDKVKVKVTLAMAPPAGFPATVHLTAYDPDHVGSGNGWQKFDPNDASGPVDVPVPTPGDNRVGGTVDLALGGRFINSGTRSIDITFDPTVTEKEEEFWITEPQPGNNYKVAAMARQEWLDVLFFGEDGVTLLWPRAFMTPIPNLQATHIMTVWRTLHAELDVMAPAREEDGFMEDEAVGDDPLRTMHQVDISFAIPQLKRAMIDLVDDLKNTEPGANPQQFDTTDGITFIHHVDGEDKTSRDAFLTAVHQKRNVANSREFWVIHVVAAYEGPEEKDFDEYTEGFHLGWSNRWTELAWLYDETLRDRGAYTQQAGGPPPSKDAATLEKRVALHEITHVMGTPHRQNPPDFGPLSIDNNLFEADADNYLVGYQLAHMQDVRAPGDLLFGQTPDPPPPWQQP